MLKKTIHGLHGKVLANAPPMRHIVKMAPVLAALAFLLPASVHGADKTGWLFSPGELSGKHAKYEGMGNCTLCHKLGGGLPDDRCLDCHTKLAARIARKEGVHARFKDRCIACHSEHLGRDHSLINIKEKEFNHDLTGYVLSGKHSALECRKCHKTQGVYTGQVGDCISCHRDGHQRQLGTDCSRCHEPGGWKEKLKFRHDVDSRFALKGAHTKLLCSKCHVSGRFKPLEHSSCSTSSCHGDFHKGQTGNRECTECHQQDIISWKIRGMFNHSRVSKFELKGRHAKLDCSKCHEKGHLKPLEHSSCSTSSCHGDKHRGQTGDKPCLNCHDKEAFNWRIYRDFDHASESNFTLKGAHLSLECSECHVKGHLRPIEHKTCGSSGCHSYDHRKDIKGKTCTECHDRDSRTWNVSSDVFDHAREGKYALAGKHAETRCSQCHKSGRYRFEGCVSCHGANDPHEKMLGAKCDKCHLQESWKKVTFNHDIDTSFPLTREHDIKPCIRCHSTKIFADTPKKCEYCHKKTGKKRPR